MENAVKHIAFIPDGNRRYAKEHGLSSFEGHKRGMDQLRKMLTWCKELGVQEVSFWGFSTENWKRTQEEVGYLMELFTRVLRDELQGMVKEGIRVRVVGRRAELPASLIRAIEDAEEATKEFVGYTVNILLNYGGRAEILEAVKEALARGMKPEEVTEESVNALLWSREMTDPDLIIRTSGEQRLSGFLPWKGSYAELYFSPKYYPAFDREDLLEALDWFVHRERRFGGDGTVGAGAKKAA